MQDVVSKHLIDIFVFNYTLKLYSQEGGGFEMFSIDFSHYSLPTVNVFRLLRLINFHKVHSKLPFNCLIRVRESISY